MRMRVVYMGTPEFAVPALQALHEHHEVVLVVSQPDRAAGRGQRNQPPPVALEAQRLGLPLHQPATLRDDAAQAPLADAAADVFVVAAYGQILRPSVLALPRLGCINIHASLLPQWRGAAPIHRAVQAGDGVTGVTIMQMERGLDSGPVWSMRAIAIGETETSGELHDRLAPLGAELLLETLPRIARATPPPSPQATSRVTWAPKLGTEERLLPLHLDGVRVAWHINAMNPWPGVRAWFGEECVALRRAAPGPSDLFTPNDVPGRVRVHDERLFLACAEGSAVEILEFQRSGRRCLAASECLRGMQVDTEDLVARASA
jgi:methionyl-tRNA formyltransferase